MAALVAGPPSPEVPKMQVPANCVMVPDGVTGIGNKNVTHSVYRNGSRKVEQGRRCLTAVAAGAATNDRGIVDYRIDAARRCNLEQHAVAIVAHQQIARFV